MRLLATLLSMLFLVSCDFEFIDTKYVIINGEKIEIAKASDSCEYLVIKSTINYQVKNNYQHYTQCSWCKNHKK